MKNTREFSVGPAEAIWQMLFKIGGYLCKVYLYG